MEFAGATRPEFRLVRIVMVLDTRWSNQKKMLVKIIVTVKLCIYICCDYIMLILVDLCMID